MHLKPIPKIFHVIWLGRKPMAKENLSNIEGWKRLHPDWIFQTWNEESMLAAIKHWQEYSFIALINLLDSPASKSDVFRLLLMKHHGGVYIDGDMEPVKPIDDLVKMAASHGGCFVGWEQNLERLNNAIIGAVPGHPSVNDALDALPCHLADPFLNIRNAAYATGPFFLTEAWKKDERVIKFPREVFYPYDWHEPWRASNCITPDTVAIHRWDATWIDDIEPRAYPVSRPLGIMMIGSPNPMPPDMIRAELAWGSHQAQRIPANARMYASMDFGRLDQFWVRVDQLRQVNRILFTPWDHVLDRNTMEAHLHLPDDAIGVTSSRLYSSKKLFLFNEHRRAKAFPFDVFKFHGFDKGLPIHTGEDVQDVFSLPRKIAMEIAPSITEDDFEDVRGQVFAPHCRHFARLMVNRALDLPGMRLSHTFKTRTTRLCEHPVNETARETFSSETKLLH